MQKNRKVNRELKTYAFMVYSEIDMCLNGDSDQDIEPSPSSHGMSVSNASPISAAGSLFDGEMGKDLHAPSPAPSLAPSLAPTVPPFTQSPTSTTHIPGSPVASQNTQSLAENVENASISLAPGAEDQDEDMDVDPKATETVSAFRPATELKDTSPESSSSNFPSPEDLASRSTICPTYVPYEYSHWSADAIVEERQKRREALLRAVKDVEDNGVADGAEWMPFPDAGQVLQGLYEAEARLKKENSMDTLEAVQDFIRAITVGLDAGRLRSS